MRDHKVTRIPTSRHRWGAESRERAIGQRDGRPAERRGWAWYEGVTSRSGGPRSYVSTETSVRPDAYICRSSRMA